MRLAAPNDRESSGVDADGFRIAADQFRGLRVGVKSAVLDVLEYSFREIWREDRGVGRIWAAA
jgi:hypothetical protein